MPVIENDTIIQNQIDAIKAKCEIINPIVVIKCITYNQEHYIKDALESFVKQQTEFPFVAIIHDDASTDNTAEIIKGYAENYPDLILPIFEKENQYSKGGFGLISLIMNKAMEATGAKYIAICEGDDYWTNPQKIQNQVEFLENNPDYGMYYTKVERIYQENNSFKDIWGGPNLKFEEFLLMNTVPTLSVMLRYDLNNDYFNEVKPLERHWLMGDYPLWIYIAHESKIHFCNDITGVYRIISESASHSKSEEKALAFLRSSYDIRKYYKNKFPQESKHFDPEYSYLSLLIYFMSNSSDKYKTICLKQLKKCKLNFIKNIIFKLRIKYDCMNKIYNKYVGVIIRVFRKS